MRAVKVIAVAICLFAIQAGTSPRTTDPPPYARSYLLTGNSVAVCVDFNEEVIPADVNASRPA